MKKSTRPGKDTIPSGMQVEFICSKCGRRLAWALPDMQMKCPTCGNWVTNKNRKKPETDLLLPVDDDQLTLF